MEFEELLSAMMEIPSLSHYLEHRIELRNRWIKLNPHLEIEECPFETPESIVKSLILKIKS